MCADAYYGLEHRTIGSSHKPDGPDRHLVFHGTAIAFDKSLTFGVTTIRVAIGTTENNYAEKVCERHHIRLQKRCL